MVPLELSRSGQLQAFGNAFVWLEFISHEIPSKNPLVGGAGNIADGGGGVQPSNPMPNAERQMPNVERISSGILACGVS
jgi:hypothetical protein